MKDRDVLFHEKWLGLAQPIEGLVFSVPVLADAQIAPDLPPGLSSAFAAFLIRDEDGPRIRHLPSFLRDFLGYDRPGMLVPRSGLPDTLSFYAPEGAQELRPSFALARGPFDDPDLDPFALFTAPPPPSQPQPPLPAAAPDVDVDVDAAPAPAPADRFFALVWDLTEHEGGLDLDAPEALTGPWRYPPTAKFERLLRHTGVPLGLLFNGRHLRLIYAPPGETTGHLTFRVEHLDGPEGRPLLVALELLLHARRAYGASVEHTVEGLLKESRRRQADVTEKLARQVFEAVEILIGGFEAAASRDTTGGQLDWLRPALEAENDSFYQGILGVVLRLVFLLYAEDQSLLPVEHPTFAEHLSLTGLYQRLSHDAGAHPESMHHRFGAYGQLLALFRAVFFGVKHGSLDLPPRRGRLFDPNTFPFLEGGLPHWTAAVVDPRARAAVRPPSIDDGTIHRALHRLVVFEGQRLSYRTLDVEQIGSIYESLMGYHVVRLVSPAVRVGKYGVWVEIDSLAALSPTDRARFLKETCGLNPGPVQAIERLLKGSEGDAAALLEGLSAHAQGKKGELPRHRALAGRLVLQPGEERRRTGSHYTPRSLTEKVVKRTLEPLLACLGPKPTAEQILELKICDPAMGSGAFLVATCRELASEVVAAWGRQGTLEKLIEQHGDAHLHARRLVAQRCLYGVDKNAAAVELAKLSLWLVTLSRTLPFTFVDHALRHGDSLVGLDFRQIQSFHWAPAKQTEVFKKLLEDALEQAVDLRQQIARLAERDDPASQLEKRRLFDFSQQAIERVRTLADACVGAFFAETRDTAREKERNRRLDLISTWLGKEGPVSAAAHAELLHLAADAREKLSPFHWWIEFPEVFFEHRPDPLQGGSTSGNACMDGVVGNPPFMGGSAVARDHGSSYTNWITAALKGADGRADLCAHFFLRAETLIGSHGTIGLIATNTIGQGDTRRSGLAQLIQQGCIIYDAVSNLPWPGTAAVIVSTCHIAKGGVAEVAHHVSLDGRKVRVVNSRLRPKPERPDSVSLRINGNKAFLGIRTYGEGFFIEQPEHECLSKDFKKSAEVLRPFIGGEEVNTHPEQMFERWVIHFEERSLEECAQWPRLLEIVRERVLPYRQGLNDTALAKNLKAKWWQFYSQREDMTLAIQPLARCLVTARVTKHLCFSFQPTDRVFSEKLYVFPLDRFSAFAVLQSRVHGPWAWLLSSTMKTDLNYSASDCFENFPFPQPDPRTVIPSLEGIGERLYEARAAYMVETQQGLTKTYNALKDPGCDDPRILELRQLHEAMDRAVLDAYGWSDVAVPPFCPTTEQDQAALQTFEDEVIDRLYVLNAERAAEEQRLAAASLPTPKTRGKTPRAGGSAEKPPRKPRGKKEDDGQGGLFLPLRPSRFDRKWWKERACFTNHLRSYVAR